MANTPDTKNSSSISSFGKYDARHLKLGMKFTAPVYFDDGENMFLAPNCTVKSYHLQAIKQWDIEVLLSSGKLTPDSPLTDGNTIPVASAYAGEIGDLEELEET
jgi:hypothetical protein